ncbi:MAG: hydroxymethylbilane synthase [Pirellulales bacterium]|nr:hydroxymethylbilane synthase [Pirellulales bacterium]
MTSASRIRLGTRGSALARWQADWVANQLRQQGVEVTLVEIVTRGDVKAGPLGSLGGQGLFTKEIQRALVDGQIDLAVHSLKDLPTQPVPGLTLAAVPPRASSSDVLIAREAASWERLREGAIVGTGSLRRRAQLWHRRADLWMEDIRGNVDTRLKKLDEGQYDAIVLAEAGLARLGLSQHVTEVLPPDVMLPAVGQGALGLETREQDQPTRACLRALDDAATHASVLAERALLAALRGGCMAPVAALGTVTPAGRLQLAARVLAIDGRRQLAARGDAALDEAAALGRRLAEQLLAQGAEELIHSARASGIPPQDGA